MNFLTAGAVLRPRPRGPILRHGFYLLGLLSCLFALQGCGYLFGDDGLFPDHSNDYLKARESEPLQMPADIGVSLPDDAYPIPELEYARVLPRDYEVPRPTALDQAESKGSVTIQRFRQDQWVLVKRSPAQTWPLVLQFLQSNQIPLSRIEAELGVIETNWLRRGEEPERVRRREARDNGATGEELENAKERYQFLLRQGVQRNTTEVWVKQTASLAEEAPFAPWQESTDFERQSNMATLLAEHLAGSPDQSSHSLLAQGIASASKVNMYYRDTGEPFLQLELPYDRGWASLHLALEKASFKIDDLDRDRGVFFTRHVPEAKKKKKRGWLRRLFGFLNPVRSAKKDAEGQKYLVNAQDRQGVVIITIAREKGPVLEDNEKAFLLRKILNKIS